MAINCPPAAMSLLLRIAFCLASLAPPLLAADVSSSTTLREDFLVGSYTLIGTTPGYATAYAGRLELFRGTGGLRVRRIIGGKRTTGTAGIEQATADRIEVLRIRFIEQGQSYEETCLITSDLDNYPRLTCQLYRVGQTSGEPRLEALFPRH